MKIRRTEESVRICLVEVSNRAVASVEETLNGVYGSGPKFVGPLSEIMNWMSSAVFGYERLNFTNGAMMPTKKDKNKYDFTVHGLM